MTADRPDRRLPGGSTTGPTDGSGATTAETRGRGRIIETSDAALPPSYDAVWSQWRVPMLQLATMLLDQREAAEDVVQEAFAGLFRRWAEVEQPAAYLRTSVVNGARSALRRRQRARLYLSRAHVRHAEGADAAALVALEHRGVLRAIATLPYRQREILVLKYWNDLTDAEIARELGISESAVRAGATRARQRLAGRLADAT